MMSSNIFIIAALGLIVGLALLAGMILVGIAIYNHQKEK